MDDLFNSTQLVINLGILTYLAVSIGISIRFAFLSEVLVTKDINPVHRIIFLLHVATMSLLWPLPALIIYLVERNSQKTEA